MSEALNEIFINNFKKDPTLTWQFFGSSTGFFRIYPGTLEPYIFARGANIWRGIVLISMVRVAFRISTYGLECSIKFCDSYSCLSCETGSLGQQSHWGWDGCEVRWQRWSCRIISSKEWLSLACIDLWMVHQQYNHVVCWAGSRVLRVNWVCSQDLSAHQREGRGNVSQGDLTSA